MSLRLSSSLLCVLLLVAGCGASPQISQTEAALAFSPDMSRADAITALTTEAFLPEQDAVCVVDAMFDASGVYNTKSAEAVEAVDPASLVAQCTAVDEGTLEEQAAALAEIEPSIDRGEVEELHVTTEALAQPFELTAATMPALNPGGMATGSVELDGTKVDYVAITPPGFQVGDVAPVLLAFPPGGQNLEMSQNVAAVVYQAQAARRGWVVVSPAAPGSLWSKNDASDLIPEMLRWMNAWVTVEGGRPHLGGMSNGGISAFHVAAQNPGSFRSLMAYPGFPKNETDQRALESLSDIPVRLWVGGADTNWVTSMETTATTLRTFGTDVELFVLPGEPHVIVSTQDGQAIFDELDAAR